MMTMFHRKSFLRSATILAIVGVTLLSGCTTKDSNIDGTGENKPTVQEDSQEIIMADFNALLESDPKADAVIAFMDKNISNVSKENASVMVTKLEEVQKSGLSALEEKYFNGETIQSKMGEIYRSEFDLDKIEETQDEELKKLLVETSDSGYKVETAEGSFFPVINYEFYKKYSSYVSEDMKDYIDIMSVESNHVPVKDAALIIGWDEMITRALAQEKFAENHKNSVKASEIGELQKRYLTFMLYGANNTPLFSYDSKVMVPDAKAAYLNALKSGGDSALMQKLGEYMDILSKTNYKLSDEAEKFRKDAVESKTL
ncbi:hypothetical protein HNQ80_000229 [Anaerosolibacter carboniphilus]|uniref:Uncharacterized protein n=1 Tax=Anaerosolibacter carboniphilus TaxID=1417629 RepID=A0A841KPY6_9FIRM|nr:hypothetical protein [Anaerosolibacter carboniphilus]MBB6214160.1 hypothetical protein [Anaerosolibacter carboniphilus]